jgi:hypothetical protein
MNAKTNEKKKSSSKPVVRRRRRRRASGIPSDYLIALAKLSDRAQVPFDRVKTDVIEFGLAAVVEHYRALIEAETERIARRKSIQHLFSDESEPISSERSPEPPSPRTEAVTEGSFELDTGEQTLAPAAQRDAAGDPGQASAELFERPSELVVQPGYRAEVDSDSLRFE